MNTFSILADERIASIREIQQNPSRMLRGITRVTRGSKTVGFFLDNEAYAEFLETAEATSSPAFVKQMAKAKREMKAGKGKSLRSVAKEYGL